MIFLLLFMALIMAGPLSNAGDARLYVVSVGINYRAGEAAPLKYCVNDAEAVAKTLKAYGGYQPSQTKICLLTDSNKSSRAPTRERIIKMLSWVHRRARAEDRVIFYFSGHGTVVNGLSGVVCQRDPDEPGKDNWLGVQEIKDLLGRGKAGNKLLILDACHSGGKSGDGDGIRGGDIIAELGRTNPGDESFAWLASCEADQTSQEDDSVGMGLFTRFLLEAIENVEGEHYIHDGLTAGKLHAYLYDGMVGYYNKKDTPFHVRQRPKLSEAGRNMVIAYRPENPPPRIVPPIEEAVVAAKSDDSDPLAERLQKLEEKQRQMEVRSKLKALNDALSKPETGSGILARPAPTPAPVPVVVVATAPNPADSELVREWKKDNGGVMQTNKDGYSLMHAAASQGRLDIMEYVHSQGVNLLNFGPITPLMVAAQAGQIASMEWLKQRHANLNAREAKNGATALHIAVANNQLPATQWLISNGLDLHSTITDGVTPLHIAAGLNSVEMATLLTGYGARVNLINKFGLTPFHIAAANGNLAVAQYLRSRGADITAKTNNGKTAYNLARNNGHMGVAQWLESIGGARTAAQRTIGIGGSPINPRPGIGSPIKTRPGIGQQNRQANDWPIRLLQQLIK